MKQFQLKHLVTSTLAGAAILALTIPATQAATTAPQAFNVSVSLTSVCTVAAIADLSFGTYTAFGSASIPAPTTSVALTCTRGLGAAPTLTFDAAGGGTNGVVAGLNYTLAAGAAVLTAGTAATPGVPGTADAHTITITGAMPAGQPGTDGVGVQTDIRTVTVTY